MFCIAPLIRLRAVCISPNLLRGSSRRRLLTTKVANPPTVAIVGGGAAGFYTAARLLAKLGTTTIDIFENLPVPHGLVRYGVAPDHPEVKNCMTKFDEVASNPRVRLFANTPVGTNVDLAQRHPAMPLTVLRNIYDAVVLAYGASEDRKLGIPGEDGQGGRVGVVSARMFVAWYNGLPEAQDVELDLESYDRLVVVGHGNVALDCARILLTDPEVLAKTDITRKAVETLRRSRIRHVEMVGRRGPLQVSFTTKELREMTKIPGLQIVCDRQLLDSQCASPEGAEHLAKSRPLKRMMEILQKHAVSEPTETAERTFTIRFLMSPLEMVYPDGLPQVMRFRVNRLEGPPAKARAVPTDQTTDISCAMALRSIGYASAPLNECEFDPVRNIVPNVAGRVVDRNGELVRGLYCSGWVKSGPVGVIATTMQNAYQTANAIASDIDSGNIAECPNSRSEVDDQLSAQGVFDYCVSNSDWKHLEKHEFDEGRKLNKPREKVTSIDKMLRIMKPEL
ncbi:NADPH-adrenodoxin reductase [Coemansia erecta]|uniref:NADPH:adrenodoxin oxidoreductase, mitochondrial n=1 Tax=Coemansia erecta TaxID=147472 RepID=A0A9W7Y0S6_9FUNG|nr:NADPH-adrenodoxin reductase [Coemansia erecta]